MLGNDLLRQRLDGFFVANIKQVAGHRHVIVLQHTRGACQRILVNIAQHHVAARLRQQHGQVSAHAGTRSRDHRDLLHKILHALSSFSSVALGLSLGGFSNL